jgi:tetratricopeptide (TPR) repeat protein
MKMFRNIAIMMILIAVFASHANSQGTVANQIDIGEKLRDEMKDQESLEAFLKAHQAEPNNSEVIWRIARAYVDMGDKEKSTNKKSLYLKAEEYAQKGVKINPNSSYCHIYLAIAVGKIALFEGGKTKVRLSKEIKEEAMKAIEIDPKNDLAYHTLGRWHREVANLSPILKAFAKALYGGLPKASNEEAIECFKKAIEIRPTLIIHRLELAKTYKETKEWKLALKEIDEIDRLPQNDRDDWEYKNEARSMRIEIEKKLR